MNMKSEDVPNSKIFTGEVQQLHEAEITDFVENRASLLIACDMQSIALTSCFLLSMQGN